MESMLFVNDTNTLNGLWYDSHKNLITSVCVELKILDKNTIAELTSKLLGERPKTKKVKDPLKPKRSKSSWLFFCDAKRAGVQNSMEGAGMGQVTKQLAIMWKALSDEERKPYQEAAVKAKDQYLVEMEKYNA